MSSESNDQDFKIVAILITTIVVAVITFVVAFGVNKARPSASSVIEPVGQAAQPVVLADSRIDVSDGMVKFFFASGSAQLAEGVAPAIEQAVAAAAQGRLLVLSGFHDSTGNPEMNARLAQRRALSVRDALLAAGVSEQSIELRKPQELVGEGSMAEARRVELVIAN
jgi:outer membrane protein OmpA-like peptidoglycan-associated protein